MSKVYEIRMLGGIAHEWDTLQYAWVPIEKWVKKEPEKSEPNNMSYKLYMGQSVTLVDEPKVPKSAIYLGKNGAGKLVVLYEHPDKQVAPVELELDDEKHLRYIKVADKTSPSGKQIYHGSLCKYFMSDNKMKRPEHEKVVKEFAAIKMLK